MNTNVTKELLEKLSLRLTEELGLHYTEERFEELERRLIPSAKKFVLPPGESFFPWLISQPWTSQHVEILAQHLTIGETYFFRDSKLWEFFENELIAELSDRLSISRRQATIWSAAACTGEEALTIAMCIERSGTSLLRDNVAIYGTDINTNFLSIARQGIYNKWSLRDTPQNVINQFFEEQSNQRYQIKSEIHQKVNFGYHNLVSTFPPAFLSPNQKADVIFCRNMLMYFSEENARTLIRRLSDFLYDDGYLLLSPNDVWFASDLGLEKIVKPGVIVFRKGRRREFTRSNTPTVAGLPVLFKGNSALSFSSSTTPSIPTAPPSSSPPISLLNNTPGTVESMTTSTVKSSRIDDPRIIRSEEEPQEKIAILINDGSYPEAIKHLEELINSGQHSEAMFHQIVGCAANLGNLDLAVSWLSKANESFPLSPNFYYLKANFLQEIDNPDEAITCLKQALFLKPDFIMAHFALLCLYRKLKQEAEASLYARNLTRQLQNFPSEAILPDSDGLSAGTLKQILDSWVR